MLDEFWAGPPVTRTLAASVFVLSILATAHLISAYRLMFHWMFILKPFPELWRFASSFMVTGGFDIIFAPFNIWQYGGMLERDAPRFSTSPGAFLVYVLFVNTIVLLLCNTILGSTFFLHPFIVALAYTYAQENRGKKVHFFVTNIDVKFLPYSLILPTLIQFGPDAALNQAMGIPAAHAYEFLTIWWPRFGGGRNLIPTPRFIARWFETRSSTATRGSGVTAFRPAQPQARSTGWTSGWSARGQGRRLGTDQ